MNPSIAVVGMACRYPGANSPEELWENTLAKRRAFRRIPSERLRLEDYFSDDKSAPDRIYATEAALIEGYEFDRVKYRVMGSTYRSADLTHWLALDIAAEALSDAGLAEENPMGETTGAIVGNTLTGEFSRSGIMRLRWPYVQRNVDAALQEVGWDTCRRAQFLAGLEVRYKSAFPPVTEESLAGGLSNTIAGRICNYFNFQGGGYTVDGACASSLLAIATCCSSLAAGDLDAAVAGGVDLSIDPFELVGFAKTGALAADEMRVFDNRSAGFWPGEGCGFVVLMRYEDAVAQCRKIHAVIRGWGISSDGSGGITRPEEDGQLAALRKAYRRAGFGIESVPYFECHGTGTSVGDATELAALTRARDEAHSKTPAVVGSVKGAIGHTKAAAGIAGFINAIQALKHQTLPPQSSCDQPHSLVNGCSTPLRVLHEAEHWPADWPLRAGISGMGFGGINAHLVVESGADSKTGSVHSYEDMLRSSAQDAELFLLAAPSHSELLSRVHQLLTFADRISRAEMGDLAAALAADLPGGGVRAAIVATKPAELQKRLQAMKTRLEHIDGSRAPSLRPKDGWFYHPGGSTSARIGFLFPGQGVPVNLDGGLWRRRFDVVRDRYNREALPSSHQDGGTDVAQPAIVTACLAALDVVRTVGITAEAAIGHSLGELTALHWAGAFDEAALMHIVITRGNAMASVRGPRGAMAGISAGADQVTKICVDGEAVISGINSPEQTVISGTTEHVEAALQRARSRGWHGVLLPVTHAFHSPLMSAAAPALRNAVSCESTRRLDRKVFSTITGSRLPNDLDVTAMLCNQLTFPVRFLDAFNAAQDEIDLWLELGPGDVLTGLASRISSKSMPVIPLNACSSSMRDLLLAVGACHVLGAARHASALFTDRFVRPFSLDWQPKFFQNPCELAPLVSVDNLVTENNIVSAVNQDGDQLQITFAGSPIATQLEDHPPPAATTEQNGATSGTLEIIRKLVAHRTELPTSAISDHHRFLADLHLNSITVGELIVRAARESDVPVPSVPLDFADASLADAARILDDNNRVAATEDGDRSGKLPAGVAPWIESFSVEWTEAPLAESLYKPGSGSWRVFAPSSCQFAESLRNAFASAPSSGIVVCLPPKPSAKQNEKDIETEIDLLLESARALSAADGANRYVMVQKGCSGAAFARTLALENPHINTCVVDVPLDHPEAASWVVREALAAVSFTESRYDYSGVRFEPRLRHCRPQAEVEMPIGSKDVLLVSGGGKGIAAECALALARETGVRLLILGRSDSQTDVELANNLQRLTSVCERVLYTRADVTDSSAVSEALRLAQGEIGAVTAILHGAGKNEPCLLRDLTSQAFRSTVAAKVDGLRNLLSAVDKSQLRQLVTFGSIIARSGLQGEADYAVANAMLTEFVESWQTGNPECRCLNLEWSVWAGAGMAERMGRIEALTRQGISPISIDQGVSHLLGLLKKPCATVSRVVTGRFGAIPTLKCEDAPLPFARFLEKPLIYYPDIELVADSVLSLDSDPYLNDHVFAGDRLMPGVMGIEAAAQAAMAVAGSSTLPRLENVEFLRPIVLPESGQVTVRVAALQRAPGRVDVVMRSDATGFQVDHFRVSCRFGYDIAHPRSKYSDRMDINELMPSIPAQDLYGDILFQTGRFQRLQGYHLLRAKECIADLGAAPHLLWFGPYLPPTLTLGDAGAHDAAIHAIQACIPHATLLPIGIDRISFYSAPVDGPCIVKAQEISQQGDDFVYDVNLYDIEGNQMELWEGLRLRRMADLQPTAPWPEVLVGPYMERMMERHLLHAPEIGVILTSDRAEQSVDKTANALKRLLGKSVVVRRRPDGKPETDNGLTISSAHCGPLTFAVAGHETLSCDAEAVIERGVSVWRDMLGDSCFSLAEHISHETGETRDLAYTRVWTALEGLRKVGRRQPTSIVSYSAPTPGWVILSEGNLRIATYACRVSHLQETLVFAIIHGI